MSVRATVSDCTAVDRYRNQRSSEIRVGIIEPIGNRFQTPLSPSCLVDKWSRAHMESCCKPKIMPGALVEPPSPPPIESLHLGRHQLDFIQESCWKTSTVMTSL